MRDVHADLVDVADDRQRGRGPSNAPSAPDPVPGTRAQDEPFTSTSTSAANGSHSSRHNAAARASCPDGPGTRSSASSI
jgi:hypothetical protein